MPASWRFVEDTVILFIYFFYFEFRIRVCYINRVEFFGKDEKFVENVLESRLKIILKKKKAKDNLGDKRYPTNSIGKREISKNANNIVLLSPRV